MAAKVLFLALAFFCAVSAVPESRKSRESRITGGTPVTIQEFPYVVALVYFYPGPQIYIQRCVGAVVSSWHVITTSFCFTGANLSNLLVRAGSTHSLSGGLLATVSHVVQHPDYEASPRVNDIAVIFLATPLPIGGTINALYLPAPGTFIQEDATFRVVSWGFESEAGPQLETLRSIYLDNVNLGKCKAAFDGVDDVAITDSVLCAARPGNIGTCFGDSGAPMVMNNVLTGIASMYEECGTDTFPDIFTRVDRFTNWIMQIAQTPRDGGVPVRVATTY